LQGKSKGCDVYARFREPLFRSMIHEMLAYSMFSIMLKELYFVH